MVLESILLIPLQLLIITVVSIFYLILPYGSVTFLILIVHLTLIIVVVIVGLGTIKLVVVLLVELLVLESIFLLVGWYWLVHLLPIIVLVANKLLVDHLGSSLILLFQPIFGILFVGVLHASILLIYSLIL